MTHEISGSYEKVPLENIVVGERFRKTYTRIEELAESIKDKGLLQPIILDANYNLCAGGRRLKAAELLEWEDIPALVREEEEEEVLREIELIENAEREDLTWIERVNLTAEIHQLYMTKYKDWSGRKTSERLNRSVGIVSMQLSMAESLHEIPELEECKSENDARKLINTLEEEALLAELAKRRIADRGDTRKLINETQEFLDACNAEEDEDAAERAELYPKPRESLIDSYRIGDVFDAMSDMKDDELGGGCIVECDPPYAIKLKDVMRSKESETLKGYNEVPVEMYPAFLERLAYDLYRIMGDNSTLILWHGYQWYNAVTVSLTNAGFTFDRCPAIWVKHPGMLGQTNQPSLYLGRGWEQFIIARKGRVTLGRPGENNFFIYPKVPTMLRIHATERPVAMIKHVISTVALLSPDAICFVPFLGSGNTLLVADELGLDSFGYELTEAFRNKFIARLEEEDDN